MSTSPLLDRGKRERSMTALDLPSRPRRNRKHPAIRGFCRETQLSAANFVYPLFIHEGDEDEVIRSMPGALRRSPRGVLHEIEAAMEVGVSSFALFPKIDESLKDPRGTESINPTGLVPRTIAAIKARWAHAVVVADVALDPYSSDGHDGVVSPAGVILNDETVDILCQQALAQARAGADIVAPSDMMDGRIGAIRSALDEGGYSDVSILAYTAKYASAFYGPFRDALDSAPRFGDKKTYQMDPANVREALREVELDEQEGADIVMVKPAGAYLDVIRALRDATVLPIAAYQVSGEYAMLKAASAQGWLDEKKAVLESLLAIRRAGADMILTYFARQAAEWIASEGTPSLR
jgi:porphobilinogen synthase